MPEASVDEDRKTPPRKRYVDADLPRRKLHGKVDAITQTAPMENSTKSQLRARIAPAIALHDSRRAGTGRKRVRIAYAPRIASGPV